MKNKGCLLMRPLMLKAKSSENFLFHPKSAKFWRFSGPDGHGLEKVSIFTAKGTSIRGTTLFKPFCVKIGWEVWPPGRFLPRSPRCFDRHQICSGG